MQLGYLFYQDLFIHTLNTSTEASSREQEINCGFTGKETHLLGLCDLTAYLSNVEHLSTHVCLGHAVGCSSLLGYLTEDGPVTSSLS